MQTKRLKIYIPSIFFEVESGAGVPQPHSRAVAARLCATDQFHIIITTMTLLIWDQGYYFLHQLVLNW